MASEKTKHFLFTVLVCNFGWFSLFYVEISGVEFLRNLLFGLSLSSPILIFRRKIFLLSWTGLIGAYLLVKWANLFIHKESLLAFALYEATLVFIIIYIFQTYYEKILTSLSRLTNNNLVKILPLIIFFDLTLTISAQTSLKLYANPLRDILLLIQSQRHQDKSLISFKLKNKQTAFVFIESSHLTTDLAGNFISMLVNLKTDWHLKQHFLFEDESLNIKSLFNSKQSKDNFLIGDSISKEKNSILKFNYVEAVDTMKTPTETRLSTFYSLLKELKPQGKRFFIDLRREETNNSLLGGSLFISAFKKLLVKLHREHPETRFCFLVLGATANQNNLRSTRAANQLKPIFLVSNDGFHSPIDFLRVDKEKWNRVETFPKKDLKVARSTKSISINTIYGLYPSRSYTFVLD